MIAGIILAAGASERMGSPKALLRLPSGAGFQPAGGLQPGIDGETFVGRLVRVLSLACDDITVVLGHHVDEIRPHIPQRARVEVNPDPARGQLSSLQTALAQLPAEAGGFCFIPVDCPAVAEETVEALAHAFTHCAPETLFVIPRVGNKRGHPVFATRAIADELLALPPTAEAREIVHKYVPRTQYVDVTDPGIFADIDTPEAYARFVAQASACEEGRS